MSRQLDCYCERESIHFYKYKLIMITRIIGHPRRSMMLPVNRTFLFCTYFWNIGMSFSLQMDERMAMETLLSTYFVAIQTIKLLVEEFQANFSETSATSGVHNVLFPFHSVVMMVEDMILLAKTVPRCFDKTKLVLLWLTLLLPTERIRTAVTTSARNRYNKRWGCNQ
jgi:hypothetical protein